MKSRLLGVLSLLGFVAVSQLAGAVGAVFTASSVGSWYAGINKPSFSPPNWVFGPVWTTLYMLMGIAAWVVWRSRSESAGVRAALTAFGVQLVLNALWSFIFFGLKNPGWAFVELVALWIAIVTTAVLFIRVSTAAGVLMIPYILWVSFAGVLNFTIWQLNR